MDSAKNELADKLKSANNVLVTVSRNPSVDQLASLLGLTLLLNKMGKHAAAVFSGQVPSTIEFLQPEETFESNTDSLRDFIIALDKGKADKLRYKVEDNVVRIFITPYKTSISEADLEFSQGDFNVDIVVALGVSEQTDLDQAITDHGRILHDATIATINTTADGGDLGTINWHDAEASSLSELVTELAQAVGKDLIDGQIATSLLTGIVAETDRFSNDKTSSHTMSASATLMSAGANQQLVASKLEAEPWQPDRSDDRHDDSPNPPSADSRKRDDGTLQIDHSAFSEPEIQELPEVPFEVPEALKEEESQEPEEPPITDVKQNLQLPEPDAPTPEQQEEIEAERAIPAPVPMPGVDNHSRPMITEPPTLGGTLTASSHSDDLDPSTDPLSFPNAEPPQMYGRPEQAAPDVAPATSEQPEHTESPQASGAPEPAAPQAEEPAPAPAPAELTPPPVEWVPPAAPQPAAPAEPAPSVPAPAAPAGVEMHDGAPTLVELEASVHSSHLGDVPAAPAAPDAPAAAPAPLPTEELDAARDEVSKALSGLAGATPEPLHALNAQPLGNDLRPAGDAATEAPSLADQIPGLSSGTPEASAPPAPPAPQAAATPSAQVTDPNAPPPVPPPLPIQYNIPPAQ